MYGARQAGAGDGSPSDQYSTARTINPSSSSKNEQAKAKGEQIRAKLAVVFDDIVRALFGSER